MINLRFHIVSIVAVFLALAVGIFAGSTLLDRATVKLVQSNQASLDAKNKALRSENDNLRALLESGDSRTREFGESALEALVGRQLRNDPVLVIATRGIDEAGLEATTTTLHNAGAALLGVMWLDQRSDPASSDDAARHIAEVVEFGSVDLGAARHDETVRKISSRWVDYLAVPLAAASAPAPPGDTSTTTTTSPAAPSGLLRALVDAELIDWEVPGTAGAAAPDLPAGGLRVVIVSGEGATVAPARVAVPLTKAVASRTKGVMLAELDHQRTAIETVESKFRRGGVVDAIRDDDAASGRSVTIDDLDSPFGRLAMVLALADLDQNPAGAYGETSTADRQFPGGS